MSKNGADWDTYDFYLTRRGTSNRQQSIRSAAASLKELASNSPSYQPAAECNGIVKPILAIRETPQLCKVALLPEDTMYIGDIVKCYDEYWLVVKLFKDEYGLISGEMWLCNHLFRFQNGDGTIIERYGVIDDGTYSNATEKAITTADAKYPMYIPLDEETEQIYIDKRFCIGTMFNQNREKILQVMKVTWVDIISQNVGAGSHLLKLQLVNDIFNKETDNVQELICDFIASDTSEDNTGNTKEEAITGLYKIDGKDTIRIGGSREYVVSIFDNNGNIIEDNIDFKWSIMPSIFTITTEGNSCRVQVPFDDNLIGTEITLSVCDDSNKYLAADKVIEVVTIG